MKGIVKRTGASGITGSTKMIPPSKSVAVPKAAATNPISRLGAYAHPAKKKGKGS